MSKYVNVPNGDYKVTVQSGGQITLDTGAETGTVEITGDLIVRGNTTTVESEDLTVRDNIIVVNSGETGAGITLTEAGLRIDRGTFSDAYVTFNEDVTWRDPITETTISGGFVFRNNEGTLVGLRANSISTGGGDLYLINSGTGVISVTGTTNYEDNVTDDDDITNKKYVDDAIDTAFATVFLSQIGDGEDTITSITITDEETSGSDSVIEFAIDENVVSRLYADRWEFDEIRVIGTRIETTSSDNDLVLSAPGTGSIRIDDTLHINSVPSVDDALLEATTPDDGVKIYVSDQYTGKTGIYFTNANNNRDELVSKNRSLLFSMLF
jgi:hypothetical protein